MILSLCIKKTISVSQVPTFILSLCLLFSVSNLYAKTVLVNNQKEFHKAVKKLEAGDTISLSNGIWNDFEILLLGQGTAENPITLTAETKGKVIISGQSNLRLAGEYLVVSGLVFKNGFTPTGSVISFRRGSKELANNSRVTEVVIDGFNNPERRESDHWVAMFGKNNRFDHNHIVGKSNVGVTMAVRLNTENSRENYHRIDHNYFGPRPILGSNGGETLRIGTSAYSLNNSYTTVENNYFDRTNGELEIISNKSGSNVYRGNVFYEARGTLTMRHGSGNLVENNVFFGNGEDHTGGIRVINSDQTIRNNYMEGLAGYRFGGALVVMNGVPNSPINRYHQVKNARVNNNSLVNSDHVQLAAGSDTERSAVPIESSMTNNLFYSNSDKNIFTVYDDISGIEFKNNVENHASDLGLEKNFLARPITMQRAKNGLLYPTDPALENIGVSRNLQPIEKNKTGVSWYPKPGKASRFEGGSIRKVKEGELASAISESDSGDELILDAGIHRVSRILEISHPLTIRSSDSAGKVRIDFERSALFEIKDGGNLRLKGLIISGEHAPDSAGNTLIRTQRGSMLENYNLIVEDSHIIDLDVNHSFNFLTVEKSTFADLIEIKNSSFSKITGSILKLDEENDDFGIYNSEYVNIYNSSFESIEGALINYYRGGTDESTFGPHFLLENSELKNIGHGVRNKSDSSIFLHGVQVSNVNTNTLSNCRPISVLHTVGEPVTRIVNNRFKSTKKLSVQELNSNKTNTATIKGNTFQ